MSQRARSWFVLVLVFNSIVAWLPAASESRQYSATTFTSANGVLAISPALPRPPAAHSTGLTAAAVDQYLRAEYQATHTLDAVVDGTFTAVRTQTFAYPRAVPLSGLRTTSTIISIPPGVRDSIEIDLSLTPMGSSLGASMRFSVAPAGTTNWSNDVTVLETAGPGTVQSKNVQVSLDQSVPVTQGMNLRLECLGDHLISCRWENLRFFNDVPGWTPLPTNRHRPHVLFGTRTAALGPIAPRAGPFMGVEVKTFTWDDLDHLGPRITFPTFSATNPVTVSVDWARTLTGSISQGGPGGAELRFLADGQTASAHITTVNTDTATVSWNTLRADVPRWFSGQHGALVIRSNGGAPHTLALDQIVFWQNGQPLRIQIPPDQTVSACAADPHLSGAIQCMHGDPVNTFSGAYALRAPDLAVPSIGPPLSLERVYISLLADPTRLPATVLGPGWRHSLDARLTVPTAQPGGEPGTLIYESSDGNRLRFLQRGSGRLDPAPGVRATLGQAADGSYRLTTRDQRVQRFDAQGRLIEQHTTAGAPQTLRYYAASHVWAGQLEQVTDTGTQRSLLFTYQTLTSGALRLAKVTDSANRQISYAYTPAGDLHTVTDLRGGVTTYGYADGTHLLTTITDPLGQLQLINRYNDQRRVQQQIEGSDPASQLTTTYSYDTTPHGLATTITETYANAAAEVRIDHYRPDGSIEYQERNGRLAHYTTFDTSFAPTVRVDGNGQVTRTQHTASGLPTRTEDATGQITSAGYNSQQRLVTTSPPFPGPITERTYDGAGNLTHVLRMGQDGLDDLTRSFYTSANQLETIHESSGMVRHFTYDALGQLQTMTVGYGSPLAQTTVYAYDSLGRMTARTVAAGTALARRDETHYNPDGTVDFVVANHVRGTFDPAHPDRDIITRFGYDRLGRQVWVEDAVGRIDATHYDARGRVDWTIQNIDQLTLDPRTREVAFRPFVPAAPDRNVATRYSYDALGRTERVTQTGILSGSFNPTTRTFSAATERVTHMQYDPQGRLETTTFNEQLGQPVGTQADVNLQTIQYYDGAGNPTWHRDPAGRWTRTAYDALNRPISTTVNYENGDPRTVDAANRAWTDGTDTDLVSVTGYTPTGQIGSTTRNHVDGTFQVTEPITDRTTIYLHDGLLRLQTTIHTADPTQRTATDTNQYQTRTYDQMTGYLLYEIDPLGRRTAYRHDDLGRMVTRTENCHLVETTCPAFDGTHAPDRNRPTTTEYDARGRAIVTIDALGQRTRTIYDGLDRPIERILNEQRPPLDPDATDVNVTTRTAYDPLGRRVRQTDPLGAVSRTSYDGLSRVTSQTDWGGRVVGSGYDGPGALRWQLGTNNRLTLVAVDGLGRAVATTENYEDGVISPDDPSDQDLTTQIVYDLAGRTVGAVDAAGQITRFRYDLLDRLIGVQENVVTGAAALRCPVTSCNVVTTYRYDRLGNRTAITDANGHTRRFSYDAADRQVSATDALGQPIGWSYDAAGRVMLQDDPRGPDNDVRYGYDELDRVTSVSATNLAAPITTSYDASARQRRLTDATGTTTFQADALGRITAVDAPGSGRVGYRYNQRGQRTALSLPNGPTISYGYGPDGLLHTVRQDSTVLVEYRYDGASGWLQQATRANGTATAYTYDRAGRLDQMETSVSGITLSSFDYTVNRLGQRTAVSETLGTHSRTVAYRYDPLGRLTSAVASSGASYGYGYDRVGNRTTASVNGVEIAARHYTAANQVSGWTYDAAGNLTNDGARSFSYDALGRLTSGGGSTYGYNGDDVLVSRTASSGTTRYTQDLAAPLSQVLQMSAGGARTDLIYGLGRVAAQQGTARTWYTTDALGSVRQTLGDDAAIGQTRHYDPWGVPEGGAPAPVFGFTGELHDAENGLVHLRARWYQPSTGTLLGRDPFAGVPAQPASLHPYQYAFNDPVHITDPSGKTPLICVVPFVVDGPFPFGDVLGMACGAWHVSEMAAQHAAAQAGTAFSTDPSLGVPYTTGGTVAAPPVRPHTGSAYPLLPPWQLPPTTFDAREYGVCMLPPTTRLPPFLQPPVARPGPTLLPGAGPLVLRQDDGRKLQYIGPNWERSDTPQRKEIKLGLSWTLTNSVPGIPYFQDWIEAGLVPIGPSYKFMESAAIAARNSSAIHFNLDAIEPGTPEFYSRYYGPSYPMTYQELDLIFSDPALFAKTTFYRYERPLNNEEIEEFVDWWSSLRR